ncbi:FkbM family methyltransferase [Aliarcobacter cryaerophilus]|uniref:FkbM family methyltransferase n=1 Tax=Aliarcobacter cryaerophilus TaxID=28198 RepID=UPI0021B628FB|nr:FkbM family methyltransferase [Aliarcobacter cryaerophilus]MCT7528309.1 FkbM family methyltransferase [Aliarcobacter cryaerophilus]
MIILDNIQSNIKRYNEDMIYREWIDLRSKHATIQRNSELNIEINNLKLTIPDFQSFIWQYRDIYLDEAFFFTSKNKKPIIIDIGANIGLVSISLAKMYPEAEIISIEADPKIYKYLSTNLKKNNIKNVNAINAAAWIKEAHLNFQSSGADAGHVIDNKNNLSIEIKSIDTLKYLNPYECIDLLKIDIEGAEFKVFPHIKKILYKVQNIILEVHTEKNKKQNISAILRILEENNFQYTIQSIYNQNSPLIMESKSNIFDCQINIFALKKG